MPAGPDPGRRPLLPGLGLALLLVAVLAAPVHAEVEEVEHYDSLQALVEAADLVVLGQVVAAAPGRVFGGCGNTAATLRVDRVLAAKVPPAGPFLTLEYFGFCGELPRLGRDIPVESGVFFLRNKGVDERQFNRGATDAEIAAESAFWRLAILAGSAFQVAGTTHVPEPLNADFLVAFDGKPFGDLVAAVEAVGAPGGQPDVPAPSDAPTGAPAAPDASAAQAEDRIAIWIDPVATVTNVAVVVALMGVIAAVLAGMLLLRRRGRRV